MVTQLHRMRIHTLACSCTLLYHSGMQDSATLHMWFCYIGIACNHDSACNCLHILCCVCLDCVQSHSLSWECATCVHNIRHCQQLLTVRFSTTPWASRLLTYWYDLFTWLWDWGCVSVFP